jgi:hypothetical protein
MSISTEANANSFFARAGVTESTVIEARRDLFLALAFVGQFLERVELVGGVHRLAHLVLGKADFGRVRVVAHLAVNGIIGRDLFLLRQRFERGKAASSGNHRKAFVLGRAHLKILQQAERGGQRFLWLEDFRRSERRRFQLTNRHRWSYGGGPLYLVKFFARSVNHFTFFPDSLGL